MNTLRNHHRYELDNFEGGTQTIQFIEKELKPGGANAELITVTNGTTNEEILRCLIDRLRGMAAKFPCRENSIAVTKIEEALMWLEKRTADRKERWVEGKALA